MGYDNLDLAILKTITTSKKHALDFANECSTKLFSADVWSFADLVVNYIKTFKDVPTLRVLIEKLSQGSNEKFAEYTKQMWNTVASFDYDEKEYKHDLNKIKTRYADNELSKLNEALNAAKRTGTKIDVNKSILDIQKTIFNIKSLSKAKTYERNTLKDTVDIFRDEFNAKVSNPNFERGVMTGYSFIDSITDGLRPGELLLIGGESGSGKSTLLMNMALQMWLQDNTIDQTDSFTRGHNILYFSLEMPLKSCRNRVYSRLSGIQSRSIRNPITKDGKVKLNADERAKLKTMLQFIKNYPYEFEIVDVPRDATAEQIEMLYEEAKIRFNPEVVVIDYLGLMNADNKEDDWLKLGQIAGSVHEIGRVHNLIMLSAVQLNRMRSNSKDAEERIGMHRIGRSALIMTHANIGIQIETRPNEKNYPDMMCHMIKNREGELNKGRLLKNLACGSLLDDKVETDNLDSQFTDIDDISEQAEFLDI